MYFLCRIPRWARRERDIPGLIVFEAAVRQLVFARAWNTGGGRHRGRSRRADLQVDVVDVHGCPSADAIVISSDMDEDRAPGIRLEIELVQPPFPGVTACPQQLLQDIAELVQDQH